MLTIFISIIAGILTGIGLGGGTFLIIGLTFFLGINQKIAQSVNLFFYVPTAITSIIINSKNKNIKWKIAINTIVGSLIGAILGAILATKIETYILKKIFGIFVGIIALCEIYSIIKQYIKSKKSNNKKKDNRKEEMLE